MYSLLLGSEASPIFILGCHRSGTSLLRSLFDGHPELNVVPIESHYFEHSGHWVQYPLRAQSKGPVRDKEAFIREGEKALLRYNTPDNPRRDVDAAGVFDPKAFRDGMENAPEQDGPERMLHYFDSILKAANGELKEKGTWVEKSVEHFEFIPLLKQWFPRARFVHIVRDPYANMVSLRNFRSRRGNFPFLPPLIRTLQWHRYHFLRWEEWEQDHFSLRYEDLLSDPEGSMGRLAEALGLGFHSTLLQPTFMRKEWEGNRATGEKLKGLSSERLDAWKKEITPVELCLVNRALGGMIEACGHERKEVPKGYWKKQKGERFKTYWSNRLFKNYLEALE